jgi:signal transduction histidine kinase
MASLFIFTAAYQGHVLRVTLAEPFLTLGTTASVAAAALLDQSRERLGLLLFAAVAAISIELVLGTSSRRWALSQRRNERLRVALTANMLDEQAREMKRLSETLVDVLGHNHDMNNTLMALRLSADALVMETEQRRIDGMGEILNDLRSGIDRVAHLAGDIKTAGRATDTPAPEVVDVVKVIESVLPTVGARFPRLKHRLDADRATTLRCAVPGGVVTIRRIVENLLINACEGDGRRSAGRVDIKVSRDPSGGRLVMVFTDDGPGFSAEQLKRGVELFASTKPQGSGLGLFTCERLVRASDGQLHRANAPGGGAQLTVILPVVRS